MTHPFAHTNAKNRAKARRMVKRGGYKEGGAINNAGEEERPSPKRSKVNPRDPTPKIEGMDAKHTLAKRARGGKMPHHKGGTKVNVIVAPQHPGGGGGLPAAQPPMAAPPHPTAPPPPAAPPGGPMGGPPAPHPMLPPGGGAPGMGMGPRPMAPGMGMPRARGGPVTDLPEQAGGGGGEGRINKMHEYGEGGFKPKKKPLHA